jgi:hypothetical protein
VSPQPDSIERLAVVVVVVVCFSPVERHFWYYIWRVRVYTLYPGWLRRTRNWYTTHSILVEAQVRRRRTRCWREKLFMIMAIAPHLTRAPSLTFSSFENPLFVVFIFCVLLCCWLYWRFLSFCLGLKGS